MPNRRFCALQRSTERRDRTTTDALQRSAQNGTSDVLASCKHARSRPALAMLRSDRGGRSASQVRGKIYHPTDAASSLWRCADGLPHWY
jgi:hypothetical protein